MFVIRIDVYESKPYPIVRHEFRGQTEMEALSYLMAHKKTDSFMRACLNTGHYGSIKCNAVVTKYTE